MNKRQLIAVTVLVLICYSAFGTRYLGMDSSPRDTLPIYSADGYDWRYHGFENGSAMLGSYFIYHAHKLTAVEVDNEPTAVPVGSLIIPSSVESVLGVIPIKHIGHGAFYGCEKLSHVTIPEGVTVIRESAFGQCSSLVKVTIPDSVKEINAGGSSDECDALYPSLVYCRMDETWYRTSYEDSGELASGYGGAFYGCNELLYDTTSVPGLRLVDGWVVGHDDSISGLLLLDGRIRGIGASVFLNCDNITQLMVGGNIDRIPHGAFEDCDGLLKVNINSGVTFIGEGAFYHCRNLSNVSIPDSVERIGYSAFDECDPSLYTTNNVVLPGARLIGDWAIGWFEHTSGSVPSVPNFGHLRGIADGAFHNCESLTRVTIPSRIKRVGAATFANCRNLTHVTIQDGVTCIGEGAFAGCRNLEYVSIPGSVTEIGENAFLNCSNLISVIIGDGVKDIRSGAFWNCANLMNVPLPDSVETIGHKAFMNCGKLETVPLGEHVKWIMDEAFAGCESLHEVCVPASMIFIGDDVFSGCSGLTNVVFAEGVKFIGERVFADCTGLTELVIPNSVTNLEDAVLTGCANLKKVSLPFVYKNREYKLIDEFYTNDRLARNFAIVENGGDKYMTSGCKVLGRTTYRPWDKYSTFCSDLPKSFTEVVISDLPVLRCPSFGGCSNLTRIVVGKTTTEIDFYRGNVVDNGWDDVVDNGWYDVAILEEMIIDADNPTYASVDGVVYDKAVENLIYCPRGRKKDLVIPATVTNIAAQAIYSCTGLKSVTIPNSVTSIGNSAFYGCSGLTSVPIPDSVTSIGSHAFNGCSGLTSVMIGNGVLSIGRCAFANCPGLPSITIPDSVTNIGEAAFWGCSMLTNVTIGVGVTNIENDVFHGCGSLASVNISDLSSWCRIDFWGRDGNPLSYAHNLCLNGELITDLVVPNGVTNIGRYAFSGCSNLTSVTIPDSVTSVGNDAFYGCSSLNNVTIPQCVCNRGLSSVFPSYSSITNVVISDGVTSIGDYSFARCGSLESITVPASVTGIGKNAFSGCYRLASVNISDLSAWCRISFGDDMANPLRHAYNLYLNGELITDLVVPNTVTSIGDYAFLCYKGLTSVVIGNGVTSIGQRAFGLCTNLLNVEFKSNAPRVGVSAFHDVGEGCAVHVHRGTSGWGVDIPGTWNGMRIEYIDGIEPTSYSVSFSPNGGAGTMAVQTFEDGKSKAISANAFTYAGHRFVGWATSAGGVVAYTDRQSITVSSDMTLYAVWVEVDGPTPEPGPDPAPDVLPELPEGYGTYSDGTYTWVYRESYTADGISLSGFYHDDDPDDDVDGECMRGVYPAPTGKVTIPSTVNGLPVVELGDYLFWDCADLTGVEIPDAVQSIGMSAFEGSGLVSVELPDSVTIIGHYAFWDVPLESVNVPSDIGYVGDRAFHGTPWLAAQGDFVFFGDGYLIAYQGTDVDVDVPDSASEIGPGAFARTSVESVRIPASVDLIRDRAFYMCESLADVSFEGNMNDILMDVEQAFEGTPWLANLANVAPSNDNFANAVVLEGQSGSVRGLSIGASVEDGEPLAARWDSTASLWWRWTAPSDGMFSFDTVGSTFDTVLGVYTGDSVAALTAVAENDDGDDGDIGNASAVEFEATAGTTYYIAVAGYREASGSVMLTWSVDGADDGLPELPSWYSTYDDGTYTWVWTEVDGGVSLTGFYSDKVSDDNPYGEWKRGIYPAPTGKVTIPSTVNGIPVVELGDSLFDGCDGLTGVEIPATVEIVGDSAFDGAGLVSVLLPDSVRSIGWRAFYGTPLESVNAPKSLESVGGYAFCGTPWLSAQGDFAFLGDGNLIAYQGAGTHVVLPTSVRVVCECAFEELGIESVTIPAGVAKIGDYAFEYCENLVDVVFEGEMWDVDMDVQRAFEGTPWLENLANVAPANDGFANAAVLEGQSASVRGLSIGASVEDGEPLAARWDSTASLWWRWTAPASGTVAFSTDGSSFDTVLGVYTGDFVAALTAVAENDDAEGAADEDDTTSAVAFDATVGTTYYIAVAGYRDAFGNVMLSWSMDGPVDVFPEPAPTPAPEPEPTPEPVVVPELYDETEIAGAVPTAAASVYDGYLVDARGNVAGSIQVKVGKPKAGLAAVKATVVVGAAKASLKGADKGKAEIAEDGPTTMRLVGGDTCEVTLGAEGLSGSYGSYLIDGARNFFSSKDKGEQGAANDLLAKWFGPVNVVWSGGTASVSIGKNGKAKVTVTLADGTKATANAQLLIGEEWLCVPVVVTKKMNLAFTLWLPRSSGEAVVEGLSGDAVVGKPGALTAGAKFRVGKSAALWQQIAGRVLVDYLPDGMAVTQSGAKWTLPKAGKVVYKDGAVDGSKLGDNPSALKLTYKAKDGSFKGSFKVYAVNGGKLKATTVNVAGIVVGGVGYGTATIKKVGSVAIQIQ